MTGRDAGGTGRRVAVGPWRPDVLGADWQSRTAELGTDAWGPAVATLVAYRPAGGDPGLHPTAEAPPSVELHPTTERTAAPVGRSPTTEAPPSPVRQGPTTGTVPSSAGHGPTTGTVPSSAGHGPTTGTVLYVHGLNDYFFQAHLGAEFAALGLGFHALDLRDFGRSIRPGRPVNHTDDLHVYSQELTWAARMLRVDHDRLILMGHSTGGLVAALWAHSMRGLGVVDALVLNSPWLDADTGSALRALGLRVLGPLAALRPMAVVSDGTSAYSQHLHVDYGGRWDYDLAWKSPAGYPVRASFLRAVRTGQERVARGLDIDCPVLVCTAALSGPNEESNPLLDAGDTVLDVERIAARAPRLGRDVSVEPIAGGIHDLALSAPGPRRRYLRTVGEWLASRGLTPGC